MYIYDFFASRGISCERYVHEPVSACGRAGRPPIPAGPAETGNIFLRDRKGGKRILVTVGAGKVRCMNRDFSITRRDVDEKKVPGVCMGYKRTGMKSEK